MKWNYITLRDTFGMSSNHGEANLLGAVYFENMRTLHPE